MRLNQSRRQLIGYVYYPQVNNNIQINTAGRQLFKVQTAGLHCIGGGLDNMRGEGFFDSANGSFISQLNNIVEKGKNLVNKGHSLYTGEIGTALRNAIPDSDNTARPGFVGETHMILKLKNGKNGVANYMGPGTEVIERVKRGDPGRTPSDTVAKRHDIDYVLAVNTRDKANQLKQVRQADNRMINSLKRIKASRLDSGRNISTGLRLIQAKKLGEDLGVLSKDKFSGPFLEINAGDSALLKTAQAQLTQEGFGLLPGNALKMKMIKKMLRQRKIANNPRGGKINISGSSSGRSRKRGLGKTYKLSPKPLVGAGDSTSLGFYNPNELQKKIKSAVPHLVKSLNLPKNTIEIINKMMPKIINRSKKSNIVNNIVKSVLPILTHKHLNQKNIKTSGKDILNIVKKVSPHLSNKLKSSFLNFISQNSKGTGMKGVGFFSDFAKGFKSVFVPGAKILGPIADALGVPEVGIPLSIAASLLSKNRT